MKTIPKNGVLLMRTYQEPVGGSSSLLLAPGHGTTLPPTTTFQVSQRVPSKLARRAKKFKLPIS